MENKQNNVSNQKFEIKKNRRSRSNKDGNKKFGIKKVYLIYCGVIFAIFLVIVLFNLPNIILKAELRGAKSQEELNLICQKKDIDCYFQYSKDTDVEDFNVYKVRVLKDEDTVSSDESTPETDVADSEGATDNVNSNNKKVHIMIQENEEGAIDEDTNSESES